MNPAETWAETVTVAADMLDAFRERPRALADIDPGLLVQRLTRNILLCGGPAEHFSREMPVWHAPTPDQEGLRPIDVLYGTYDRQDRSIEIYVNRISQDARMFDATPEEVIEIVRIHEHAHAVVHLGVNADNVHKHLSNLGDGHRTAWADFLALRTQWAAGTARELHELLAQAITYSALASLPVPLIRCRERPDAPEAITPREREVIRHAQVKSEKLRNLFDAIEARQPAHYRLSPQVKDGAMALSDYSVFHSFRPDWSAVLDAARGEIDPQREPGFELIDGITTLICSADCRERPCSRCVEKTRQARNS